MFSTGLFPAFGCSTTKAWFGVPAGRVLPESYFQIIIYSVKTRVVVIRDDRRRRPTGRTWRCLNSGSDSSAVNVGPGIIS